MKSTPNLEQNQNSEKTPAVGALPGDVPANSRRNCSTAYVAKPSCQPCTAEETQPTSQSRIHRLWLVDVAGLLYAVSMHKFAMRDPLSTNTGIQAIVEVLGITGAFVCISAAAWKGKRRYTTSMTCLSFAAFGLFALASSWRSYSPSLSFVKGSLLLVVVATGYLASQTGLGLRYFRSIYWSYTALLLIGLIVGAIFPHQYPLFSVDSFTGRTRLSVFDTFPGTMGEDAALLLLVAPIIYARVEWVSQTFLLLMLVFAGGKTSTALLTILILIRFTFSIRRWRSWQTVLVILSTACVTVLGLFLLQDSGGQTEHFSHIAESVYGKGVGADAAKLDGRLDLWTASLKLLQDSVFVGYGLDGTRDIMLKVASWAGTSHNGYLEEALSAGILGFVFFLFGIFSTIRVSLRATFPLRLHATLILIFLLTNAIIGGILSSPSYFGFLVMLWLSYQAVDSARTYELIPTGPLPAKRTYSKVRPRNC